MFYNIVLEFWNSTYPDIYLIIPENELSKLVEAYENKKESVFINGEKIFINDPTKFKIYDNSKITIQTPEGIRQRIDDYLYRKTLNEINLSHLNDFGKDVTSKFITGGWGDKKPELFNFYINIDGDIQIKHGYDRSNIETILMAIKNGQDSVFVNGSDIKIKDFKTIKIFDTSKLFNRIDKGELKQEMKQRQGILKISGLNLLLDSGVEVTHKFEIIKPKNSSTNPSSTTTIMQIENPTLRKLFISHSSQDDAKIQPFLKLLKLIGVPDANIFYCSVEGYGLKPGENIIDGLKRELNNDIFALFMLSENFYASAFCLCEMGAVWIKSHKQIPILIPPTNFSHMKGVFPDTIVDERFTFNADMTGNITIGGLASVGYTWSLSANNQDILISDLPLEIKKISFFKITTPSSVTYHIENLQPKNLELSFIEDGELNAFFMVRV